VPPLWRLIIWLHVTVLSWSYSALGFPGRDENKIRCARIDRPDFPSPHILWRDRTLLASTNEFLLSRVVTLSSTSNFCRCFPFPISSSLRGPVSCNSLPFLTLCQFPPRDKIQEIALCCGALFQGDSLSSSHHIPDSQTRCLARYYSFCQLVRSYVLFSIWIGLLSVAPIPLPLELILGLFRPISQDPLSAQSVHGLLCSSGFNGGGLWDLLPTPSSPPPLPGKPLPSPYQSDYHLSGTPCSPPL